MNLVGFEYRFEPASSARSLLLLHGTGADENDLIPLGRALDPDANLLSPRGKVLEHGSPRFFRRFAEGVLDIDDLKERTHELVSFLDAATGAHGLDSAHVVAVGYSNGANIASSVLLLHPARLRAAVLLRPMFTYEPEIEPDLAGKPVLIASGRNDPLVDPDDVERFASMLERFGADVHVEWSSAGHPLRPDEVRRAQAWLNDRA